MTTDKRLLDVTLSSINLTIESLSRRLPETILCERDVGAISMAGALDALTTLKKRIERHVKYPEDILEWEQSTLDGWHQLKEISQLHLLKDTTVGKP